MTAVKVLGLLSFMMTLWFDGIFIRIVVQKLNLEPKQLKMFVLHTDMIKK